MKTRFLNRATLLAGALTLTKACFQLSCAIIKLCYSVASKHSATMTKMMNAILFKVDIATSMIYELSRYCLEKSTTAGAVGLGIYPDLRILFGNDYISAFRKRPLAGSIR